MSDTVTLDKAYCSFPYDKGKNNMIGISIGGGAPFCPTVYIVQVRLPTEKRHGFTVHVTS